MKSEVCLEDLFLTRLAKTTFSLCLSHIHTHKNVQTHARMHARARRETVKPMLPRTAHSCRYLGNHNLLARSDLHFDVLPIGGQNVFYGDEAHLAGLITLRHRQQTHLLTHGVLRVGIRTGQPAHLIVLPEPHPLVAVVRADTGHVHFGVLQKPREVVVVVDADWRWRCLVPQTMRHLFRPFIFWRRRPEQNSALALPPCSLSCLGELKRKYSSKFSVGNLFLFLATYWCRNRRRSTPANQNFHATIPSGRLLLLPPDSRTNPKKEESNINRSRPKT